MLVGDLCGREDLGLVIYNPDLGSAAAAFPFGGGRARAYFGYQTSAAYRIQRRDKLPLFFSESIRSAPIFADIYSKAKDCGPLASFETSDSWIEHPYREGLALIGDAAATSDPCYGQGMGLTLRDVRVLRDHLRADSDGNRAGHAYAAEHDSYFGRCHKASSWLRFIFQDPTPRAARQRQKAMPLIAQDPTRVPDHTAGGPDLPTDDFVRDRFFGEI